MKRALIRSTIFNVLFFLVTAFACVVFLPLLFLPRKFFVGVVKLWLYMVLFLEYTVLNLRFEKRGFENLPQEGSFIIAAKHQSPYETMKLHLLFDDPAIVLKKELLSIPLWGLYLKKSGVIAIDRGTPDEANTSIAAGAAKVMKENRPIIIFPQGTRVRPEETPADRRYKSGVAKLQEATNLPVVPMALNTGLFWPRSGWLKSPGKITFECLPPIAPGKERKALMKEIEEKVETSSNGLMNEARAKALSKKPKALGLWFLLFLVVLACAGYGFYWFHVAEEVRKSYIAFLQDMTGVERIYKEPVITGFPGPIMVHIQEDFLRGKDGTAKIENIVLQGWPVPLAPINIQAGPVTLNSFKWSEPLVIDSFQARVTYWNDILNIKESHLYKDDFHAIATGEVNLKYEPVPVFHVRLRMENHDTLLQILAEKGVIKEKAAAFMNAGFSLLRDSEGYVNVPLTQKEDKLYAGPLLIAEFPSNPS